jgi:hypothetical protein
MREWSFVIAPVALVAYFIVRPDQFGLLIRFLGRFVH